MSGPTPPARERQDISSTVFAWTLTIAAGAVAAVVLLFVQTWIFYGPHAQNETLTLPTLAVSFVSGFLTAAAVRIMLKRTGGY